MPDIPYHEILQNFYNKNRFGSDLENDDALMAMIKNLRGQKIDFNIGGSFEFDKNFGVNFDKSSKNTCDDSFTKKQPPVFGKEVAILCFDEKGVMIHATEIQLYPFQQ